MGHVDLESILRLRPENLTQEQKDDIFEQLSDLQDEPEGLEVEGLVNLFAIAKEIMLYKGQQVETLLGELEVLTPAQGTTEDREELVKVTRQAEQLVEELQQKEKELLNEKQQVEKLLKEVSDLQKDKNELRREIILIQNEAQSGALQTSLEDEPTENVPLLKDTIQSKNKHILQLLSDIEVLEKENQMLNTKLNAARREIADATTVQTKLSGENISLREANYQFQEKITTLEERNAGLTTQVSELVAEKNKKDAHLDQLIDDLEERIVKWQEVFVMKENEVTELKARLAEAAQSPESRPSSQFATNYTILSKTIEQQEDMIESLRNQLKRASEDLTKSSAEMMDYKNKVEKGVVGEGNESLDELREELEKANAQIVFLQEKTHDAEQDAQFRAEEMTELIIQLREYEDGIYGLPEARKEIKDLKKQIGIRENQILNLVQQLNELSLKENGEPITAGSDRFNDFMEEEDKSGNLDLKSQLTQMQQTAINLSVQNFDLRAKVMKLTEELNTYKSGEMVTRGIQSGDSLMNNGSQPDQTPVMQGEEAETKEDIENRIKMVIEENEALRKGMHEIMESIKNQDGSAKVVVESETLERLLEMLDSRHISGWYHPAMRLQVALNKLQGNNDALRQELRESRFRESYFQAELQTTFLKVGELEERIKGLGGIADQGMSSVKPPVPAPRKKSTVSEIGDSQKAEEAGVVGNLGSNSDSSGDLGAADTPQEKIATLEEPSSQDDSAQDVLARGDEKPDDKPSRPSSTKSAKSAKSSSRKSSAKSASSKAGSPQKPKSPTEPSTTNPRNDKIERGVQQTLEVASTSTQTDITLNDQLSVKSSPKPVLSRQASVKETIEESSEVSSPRPPLSRQNTVVEMDKKSKKASVNGGDQQAGDPVSAAQQIWEAKYAEDEERQRIAFQAMLQQKCDELRSEFSNIKSNTELALSEMNSTKEAVFNEIKNTITKISDEVDSMKKQPRQVQISTSELGMKAYQAHEMKLNNYGLKLDELRKSLYTKETVISAMEGRIRELQTKLDATSETAHEESDKRVLTLQDAAKNLQTILNQKEEVISSYQQLIKENGEEYNKLLNQFRELEASTAKTTNRVAVADTQAVGVLMEKWLTRVHHLEDDIRDMAAQLADSSAALEEARKDAESWKQQALSAQQQLNDEPEKELARKVHEIEDLRLQLKDLKAHTEAESRLKIHQETNKLRRKEENFRSREREYESEINRLKHQLAIRTSKGSTKCVKKEMIMSDRIKELEEEIELMKQRERSHLQMRRDKCADEVAKWEERKKLQTNNERLKADIKEKSVQVELLEGQVNRLKQIISRMERERITLQRRLKISEGMLAKNVLNLKGFDDNRLTESRLGVSPSPILQTSRSQTESPCSDVESSKVLSKRDLIKAISALKKVVTRLRAEKENFVHKDYVEQLRKELRKVEENYMDAVERSLSLEEQLRDKLCGQTFIVGSREDENSNAYLREQLVQKCELLGKVKVLLQRAMVREKQLIHQVTVLEKLVPPEKIVSLRQQYETTASSEHLS
uniref:Centrosomal protein n=2 Tax=Lygus hesperus TaxID=30085 RepID=A0A146M1W4_LYGHE